MTKIPTIDVYRDGKHAIINRSDLAEWQKAGWTPEQAKEPAEPEPSTEPELPKAPEKKPEPKQKPSK